MQFSEIFFVLAITVVPLWLILHYSYKFKSARGLSREDEQMLGDVWETTKRMEERIDTLERILDDQHPNWRNQDTSRARSYQ